MAGYRDFMISEWMNEYLMVPLGNVVLGRKPILENSDFWDQVINATGQPHALTNHIDNTGVK